MNHAENIVLRPSEKIRAMLKAKEEHLVIAYVIASTAVGLTKPELFLPAVMAAFGTCASSLLAWHLPIKRSFSVIAAASVLGGATGLIIQHYKDHDVRDMLAKFSAVAPDEKVQVSAASLCPRGVAKPDTPVSAITTQQVTKMDGTQAVIACNRY